MRSRDSVIQGPAVDGESARTIPERRSLPTSAPEGVEAALPCLREKVRTLVSIAASNGSSISSAELFLLLPSDTFVSPKGLEDFVSRDSSLQKEMVVSRSEIAFRGSEDLTRSRAEQVRQTARRVRLAQYFADRLVAICPWLRLVAISGSTAYGGTKARDDIDFFVVTRRHRLWVTLLLAMVLAKIYRMRNSSVPVYCFNRILDESQCPDAFRTLQEPLFAREALSLRVLKGQPFYRGLLQSASWMEKVFPGLYHQASTELHVTAPASADREPRLWTIANWIAFASLAPYITLASLLRNGRLQKAGNVDARYRTIIRPGFFAYESRKFDLLRDAYRRAF